MMKHSTLGEMLNNKPVHKTFPDDSVRTACIIMSSANVGALPVVDLHGNLVGILSERDVIKRSVIVYRPAEETSVKSVMTPNPKWLPPDATPSEAIQLMLDGKFRHLPICAYERLVGIVSIRDFHLQDEWTDITQTEEIPVEVSDKNLKPKWTHIFDA